MANGLHRFGPVGSEMWSAFPMTDVFCSCRQYLFAEQLLLTVTRVTFLTNLLVAFLFLQPYASCFIELRSQAFYSCQKLFCYLFGLDKLDFYFRCAPFVISHIFKSKMVAEHLRHLRTERVTFLPIAAPSLGISRISVSNVRKAKGKKRVGGRESDVFLREIVILKYKSCNHVQFNCWAFSYR